LDITDVATQAGTVVQRIWASQPGGGSLRLGFVNIPDADAEKLAKIWDRSKGKRLKLTLPTRFFEGEDPALLEHLELKGQPLTWGFREKPTIRSVIPGISSIDLEFKGRGYGGGAIPVVTTPDPPRVMPIDPLPVLLELSPAGLRANRIGKASPLALALTFQPLEMVRRREMAVAALPLVASLPSVSLLASRVMTVQPLGLTPSLPNASLSMLRKAINVSPLALTLSLPSVNVMRLAILGGYYTGWVEQNVVWQPDYLSEWWGN
jgi:hypothetical protein